MPVCRRSSRSALRTSTRSAPARADPGGADRAGSLVDPLMAQLRDLLTTGELKTVPKALAAVRETLVAALTGELRLRGDGQRPRVILVVGVNGSGKTTTAAKLAKRLKD